MSRKLELKDIVLIGRTFDEYYKMFGISSIDGKKEKILDVASGVSSFCAEANSKGYNVTASDRIYCFSAEEIEGKCIKDLELTIKNLSDVKDLYRWELYKDIEDLKKQRKKAYTRFIEDFKRKRDTIYIETEYPKSNFKDKQFTVSLISHFLFMYDEHLDYEFHKQTIKEIIRITSKEIRIFPIVNLKGEKSMFVNKLMSDDNFTMYKMQIVKVNYEFIKGGNEMLIIKVK
ncbi:hypothetical protein CPJCM30710_17670 [Clostridium polyendosporum]|uniref:SAM-dependent methyltransferase n=1 Tax=Clostridium polyendosporum TaxID=69208 RepID=A0A919VGX9_9CLOT|nr:hypothetical protein [Clostridium polyendosporum]GIM29101.1 hypothetical protein CPJCM30710_17670 [Clostridium polyendosporum]